jgi:hypothetical protein
MVFGYNPITWFLEMVREYIRPRWIGMDRWIVDDILKSSGYQIRYRTEYKGKKVFQVHSWSMLVWEWKRMLRKFKKQKWWTEKSYKKDPEKLCPKCNQYIPSSCID